MALWHRLPKIPNPTQADIDKWHAHYIEKLVDLFERNKAKFGQWLRWAHVMDANAFCRPARILG